MTARAARRSTWTTSRASESSVNANPPASGRSLVSRALPLAAIAVLVVNDHILKQRFPGLVTGKLSDFAGLFFFPLFLADALGFVGLRTRRVLVAACIATAVVFALVKTTELGHEAYCIGLGALQWPFRALAHGSWPALGRVRMTMDVTDLVALTSVVAAYRYARARSASSIAARTSCERNGFSMKRYASASIPSTMSCSRT